MSDMMERNQQAPGEEGRDWCESDDGWGALIAELEAKLNALSPDYTISQVKEKFGGLRYYASAGDVGADTSKQFYDLIRQAEAKSYVICECCGQPGRLTRRGGWYKTLCSVCSSKLNFVAVGDDELD